MQENLTLEQQKKELQMTLSKFTHEIRNPVALIQSELQMLASAHPELNSYDGWYGIMENLEYIRELLNELSRYNNGLRHNHSRHETEWQSITTSPITPR